MRATIDNARRNGVAPTVTVVPDLDAVSGPSRFDVVVANVSAGVLVELAERVVRFLAADGVAILTGILDERAAEVVERYGRLGGTVTERESAEGWVLLGVRAPVRR